MKKNLVKIITLILSCLLLIGAAVGITAFAAEGDTVEIAMKNISYQGAIKIVYLVDTNVENAEVGIVFDTVPKAGDSIEGLNYNGNSGKWTVNEKKYTAVYSDGIYAKDYRKVITATPVIVEGGKVVTVGTTVNYSPFIYAMNRFDAEATATQDELYESLLDYSAAVQTVLGYTDSNIAELGGWADEYYQITLDGVPANQRGNAANAGTVTADRFKGDLGFKGWTNKGEAFEGWTTLNLKPGTYELVKNYGAVTNLNDGNALGNASIYNSKGETTTLSAADGVINFTKTEGKTINTAVKFASDKAGVYAQKYVFEADFNVDSWNMTKNSWMAKFVMWAGGSGNDGEMFNATISGVNGGQSAQVGGVHFNLKTWNHITMIAEIAADGTVYISTYVNGVQISAGYQKSIHTLGDYKMVNAGLQFRDGGNGEQDCTQATILFDNVEAYAEGAAASYEVTLDLAGGEGATSVTVTMGEVPSISTPTHPDGYKFVGWYIGENEVDTSAAWNWCGAGKDADDNIVYGKAPTLTAKWATPVNVTLVTNGGTVGTLEQIFVGQAYELPIPTNGDLIFSGWLDADGNIIPSGGSEWTYGEGDVTLTAKWYIESAGQTYADYTGNGDQTYAVPGYSMSNVDAADKVYVFKTTFTYNGTTGFKGTGTTADPFTKYGYMEPQYVKLYTVKPDGSASWNNYAQVSKADGEFVNADGVAVTENGVLKAEYASLTKDQVFLSTLTWAGVTFEIGEEYEIEYTIIMNGADAAPTTSFFATKKSTGEVKTGTMGLGKCNTVEKFYWESPRGAAAATGNADNTFTTSHTFADTSWSVRVPAIAVNVTLDAQGGTLEGDTSFVVVGGTDYALPTPTYEGLIFGGWYNGDTPVGTSGKWSIAEDVTLTAKWMSEVTGVSNNFDDGTKTGIGFGSVEGGKLVSTSLPAWSGSTYFAVNSGATLVTGNAAGTKYIFEADFTYTNGANGSDRRPAFFGFSNIVSTGNSGCYRSEYVYGSSNKDSAGDAEYVTMYGQNHYKNVTYKIRYEYVVGETDIHVYVDGDYKGAYKTSLSYATDNTAIYGFVFYCRDGLFGATFDNTYCGVQVEATKVNYTLDATHGTLPEGASTNGSAMTGAAVNLPTPTAEGLEFLGWYVGNEAAVVNGLLSGAVTDGATLTAKWATVTTQTGSNPTGTYSAWSSNSTGSYTGAYVDAVGTVYTFSTKYTYKGLTAFSIADGVVTSTIVNASDKNFGFPRIYVYTGNSDAATELVTGEVNAVTSSAFVNAEGVTVVGADGKLLPEYASLTNTDIFYKQIKWWGYTFDINVEYDIVIKLTLNDNAKPDVVVEITPAGGTTQTIHLTVNDVKATAFRDFQLNARNNSAVAYKVTYAFAGSTIEAVKPVADHLASEVAAPEFIKDYANTEHGNLYFKSCTLCGKMFDEDFYDGKAEMWTVGVAPSLDKITISGAVANAPALEENDSNQNGIADGSYYVVKQETVTNANGDDVTNTYVSYIDDHASPQSFKMNNQADGVNGHYVLSFDFRFMGSGDYRTDYSSTSVFYFCTIGNDTRTVDNKNTAERGILGDFAAASTTDDSYLTMNGKKLTKGEWYTITYEFTWNATHSNYDIVVYIDGVNVLEETGSKVAFDWEIRYSRTYDVTNEADEKISVTEYSDVRFDIDNVSFVADTPIETTPDPTPAE